MRLKHCGMASWSACAGKNFRSILLPRMHLVQNDIWCDSSLYTCVIVRVSFFAYLHTISMYITLSTHDSRFPDKTQREMASQSAAVCFEACRSLYFRAYFGIDKIKLSPDKMETSLVFNSLIFLYFLQRPQLDLRLQYTKIPYQRAQ